jgi:hypothetical protein
VAYSVTCADAAYQTKIKGELETAIETYFRQQLIYGIAYEDAELGTPDFSGYEDFADEIETYRQQFETRGHQHAATMGNADRTGGRTLTSGLTTTAATLIITGKDRDLPRKTTNRPTIAATIIT